MRIGVVIERLPYYRLVGPIIDEALRRGWPVECWHDYGQAITGTKAYQFPAVSAAPTFQHGTPVFRTYHAASGFDALVAAGSVDAVLSFRYLHRSSETAIRRAPLSIGLQDLCDSIYHNGLRGLLAYDLVSMHTPWWLDWTVSYLAAEGSFGDKDDEIDGLAHRFKAVGFPELDQRSLIEGEVVRRELGIDSGRPVVVLLPFPGAAHPGAFWPNKIFLEPSRLKQAAGVVLRRRFEYAGHVWRGWNDAKLVASLRTFCDRHHAVLIVKSRLKTPVPDYLREAADITLNDESYYPASILKALRIADLCISFCSGAVVEAVACGVPHVCLTFSLDDYSRGAGNTDELTVNRHFYDLSEGGLFNFKGASTAMSIPEAIVSLREMSLTDFVLDDAARAQYVARYCGPDDDHSSGRLLDAVVDLCQA